MRKFIFIILLTFSFTNIYKAECNYTELKNVNALASFVEYSYEYDETTNKFNIVLNNVVDELKIIDNITTYEPESGLVKITGYDQGSQVKLGVYSSNNAECINEYLRAINIRLPYLNKYFGTSDCYGHENLEVCSNKFLNYELSQNSFETLINKDFEETIKTQKPDEEIKEEEKTSFWENSKDTIIKYGLPIGLVTITTLITFIICNTIYKIIYRKTKHGL